jgi:hypothetical protein
VTTDGYDLEVGTGAEAAVDKAAAAEVAVGEVTALAEEAEAVWSGVAAAEIGRECRRIGVRLSTDGAVPALLLLAAAEAVGVRQATPVKGANTRRLAEDGDTSGEEDEPAAAEAAEAEAAVGGSDSASKALGRGL